MPASRTAAVTVSGPLGPWIDRVLEVGGGVVPALRALGRELPERRRAAWGELCQILAAGDAERAARAPATTGPAQCTGNPARSRTAERSRKAATAGSAEEGIGNTGGGCDGLVGGGRDLFSPATPRIRQPGRFVCPRSRIPT